MNPLGVDAVVTPANEAALPSSLPSTSNDIVIDIGQEDVEAGTTVQVTTGGTTDGMGFTGMCSGTGKVGMVDVVEQDISLAEVKDFKAPPSENAAFSMEDADPDAKRPDLWKQLAEQEKTLDPTLRGGGATMTTKIWTPEDAGYRSLLGREPGVDKHFRTKLHDMQVDTRSKDLDFIRQTLARGDAFSSIKGGDGLDAGGMDAGKSSVCSVQDVLKGGDTLGRGLQSSVDRLHSLKVPQAMVAFAQAAAKVNDLPGWPLLSSSKPQLQKCEKCSREFCSTLNYRRHIRLHRRSAADDKDLRSEKTHLASFLSKLSTEEASEMFSAKNLMLENLSGAAAAKALATFLQQPGHLSYPLAYMSAGSALLDVVDNKRTSSPTDLLKVLEDASEGTFLCGGTSAAVQRFVYHGEVQKVGLEDKNLVASLSFLVEQKLVKAWMAEKDAEALRCEKALVEEEEAAQRKRAKILEKKRQKKIRQKGSKEKERKLVAGQPSSSPDSEHEEVQSPRIDEDDYSLATGSGSSSSSVVSSGQDQEGVDDGSYLKENGTWYEESNVEAEAEPEPAPLFGGESGGEPQEERSNASESMVDHKIGKVLRDRRRPNYLSSYRRRDGSDGYFQSSFKARRVQNSGRNDYSSQAPYRKKLGGMYRGIVKGGNARAVWTRKVNRCTDGDVDRNGVMAEPTAAAAGDPSPTCSTCSFEEMSDSTKDHHEGALRETLIVGSLNVPLGNFSKAAVGGASGGGGVWTSRRSDEEKPVAHLGAKKYAWSSSSPPGKSAPTKVWRAVGKVGEHPEADCRSSLTSYGDDSETQAQNKRSHADMLAASDSLMSERAILPNVNVAVSSEEALSSAEHSPSPTSTALASFLSQRWATAVGNTDEECVAAGPFDKPMAHISSKIWPVGDEATEVSGRVRGVANTCSKSARRWHRSSKERHVDQRYMPRRQVFAAQH